MESVRFLVISRSKNDLILLNNSTPDWPADDGCLTEAQLLRQLKLLFVDFSVEGNLRVVLRRNHCAAFLVGRYVLQGKIGLRVDPNRKRTVGSVLPLQANFVF